MIQARLKTGKKAGPPAFVAAVVQALTPRKYRAEVTLELLSHYTTFSSYCFFAICGIVQAIVLSAYLARDRRRFAGDLACVFIAYHTLPLPSLAGILIIAGLTLMWRDGHMYDSEALPADAAADGLIVGAGLVVWQLLCLVAASSFAAPPLEFLLGLAFAIAMLAGWRFTWRWEKKQIPYSEAVRAYRDAFRIYWLWIVAVLALIAGNTRVVVDPKNVRDFMYVAVPFVCFLTARRRQSDRIGGGLLDWRLMWVGQDFEKTENAARTTQLFSKRMKTWRDFSAVHLLEGLFFVSIGLEILSVPVGVLVGWIPIDEVHWFLWTVDAAVFITLSRIWIEVKKIHERVATLLLAGK
jgi:hypothetical protein